MTIEQATVKALSSLNLRDELAIDIINIAIVSVIGYAAVKRIYIEDADCPDCIADDLNQLFYELEHMNVNEMVKDFLRGNNNEDINKDTV